MLSAMATAGLGREQAILRPTAAAGKIRVGREAPPEPLAPWVDYLWWVRWDTASPHHQAVVPAPVVHVTAEDWEGTPRLVVTGVQRRRFDQTLSGRGFAVAAAFRPACFRPFLGHRVADLTDVREPAAQHLGRDDHAAAGLVLGRDEPDEVARALLTDWLLGLDIASDPLAQELASVVERAEHD